MMKPKEEKVMRMTTEWQCSNCKYSEPAVKPKYVEADLLICRKAIHNPTYVPKDGACFNYDPIFDEIWY